ncbi:SIS domain-containing protein [Listeria monocytogenes]|uniref:Glucosamine--fructose-6-phosphate aminotransferase n=1 Tax=Listeria monocytogenes TaxID=1639 RepID=A0A5L7PCY7_LISMN|nr:SIS domain-containing protein [Listeria monocytogenes]EAE3712652.1 SIS domain-containing protein [Listeria monocytogenes serotype 1/2b]MDA68212.1 SIS domain-containing protein [Listeria monocytogenes serotype 3b]AGR06484.1 sugar isomerase [Listeria monocytogenes]AKG89028.1 SIS domain-containing protein [Listeria monocytogenes]AKI47173.1 glucosamine-fructose-6-phosphate aminotransferase, putative [Listeria monocytogenes]
MKNMDYYIRSEQSVYENIIRSRKDLLQKVIQMEKVDYQAIVIFATGSSSNAAFAAQLYMSDKLAIPVYVEEPSTAGNYMLHLNKNTLYIAISQGGHSYSTIHLVKEIERQGGIVFTLTSDLTSPIAKESTRAIDLGMAIEEMPYVTLGYSATILMLNLMALELALLQEKMLEEEYQAEIAELKKITANLPKVVEKSAAWVDAHTQELMEAERVFFIGYGAAYGVAREGETKVTETIRITAFGKELEEYMHGPYIGLSEQDYIIFLEPQGLLEDRAEKLKQFLQGHVKKIRTFYADAGGEKADDLLLGVRAAELLTPLFMTIPVHLLSFEISKKKGINLEVSAFPEFDQITKSKI